MWLDLSGNGWASIHLEKGHTATPRVVSPFFPGGRSRVTKSKAHNLKGALPFHVALMYGNDVNLALSTYVGCARAHIKTQSLRMWLQKYLTFKRRYSRSPPGYASCSAASATNLARLQMGTTSRYKSSCINNLPSSHENQRATLMHRAYSTVSTLWGGEPTTTVDITFLSNVISTIPSFPNLFQQ